MSIFFSALQCYFHPSEFSELFVHDGHNSPICRCHPFWTCPSSYDTLILKHFVALICPAVRVGILQAPVHRLYEGYSTAGSSLRRIALSVLVYTCQSTLWDSLGFKNMRKTSWITKSTQFISNKFPPCGDRDGVSIFKSSHKIAFCSLCQRTGVLQFYQRRGNDNVNATHSQTK